MSYTQPASKGLPKENFTVETKWVYFTDKTINIMSMHFCVH